uniref:4-hydroxy-tetrahydrodipicolinate synthase n=1 Tax=Eucampia antarctica TaxID=49252 RepID=A0A7S2SA65_9STRA|mmetsp:Transcript_5356/g.5025  ORF Transcript_5356/g.5025 Transcript_5356/m.5025 type:complete len:352 (+) Transcript_5356:68-1123(+)
MMKILLLTALAVSTSVEGFQTGVSIRTGNFGGFPMSWTSQKKSCTTLSMSTNANEIVPLKPGSFVALVTPFNPENGEVDIPALRTLLQFHLESGTDGLCILGTTGEASTLSMKERELVLKIAVEMVKGKIPILVGTGTINPMHVKEMTLQAMDLGCDASLVVTPYYVKPPQRGLVKHFVDAADLGLPVMIYNVPGRTGVDCKPESIALCAEHENIVAVKEATGDLTRLDQIRQLTTANKLLLYSGDDSTEAEFVLRGGDGCVSVTANVAPKAMHELMMAALRGDKDEVNRINTSLSKLHEDIFCEANPIPAKWAMQRIGKINSAYCRPPMDQLDPQFEGLVEEALSAAGLI